MKGTVWYIIGRGWNGWHASGLSPGFRSPALTSSTGGTLEGYASAARNGAPVYDAEAADEDAFSRFIVSGPMAEPGRSEPHRYSSPEHPGPFDGFGAFDSLPVRDWLGLLRKHVPGVRFGRVVRGAVVWED